VLVREGKFFRPFILAEPGTKFVIENIQSQERVPLRPRMKTPKPASTVGCSSHSLGTLRLLSASFSGA